MPRPAKPEARVDDAAGPDEALAGGMVLPGGKIDADSVRRAIDAAREQGLEDEEDVRTVTFRIRRDLDKRLDKYLVDRIAFLSRTQLQALIDEGGVTVNGRRPKASTKIGAGDEVEVVVPAPPESHIQPEDIPLDVLYEDEHLIVLNKQAGIIVHPARTHLKGTLLSALAFHFLHRSPRGGGLSGVGREFARPGVVHRLDRHTSGCIVFAKTDEAHWKLGAQFEHRRVDKRYLAVVHGRVEPVVQVLDDPMGPHPSREKGYREKQVVRHDDLGKPAVTIVRVRERFETGGDATRATLVELELKTGRTHQIRVHLSHHGWPIIGDDMYGGRVHTDPSGREIMAHPALHAAVLGFRHPITDAPMVFTAPLRGEVAALVHDLRARSGGGERVDAPGARVDLAAAVGGADRG
jgi:23S rRNA pseudouridine1911/1915/1917 synthase